MAADAWQIKFDKLRQLIEQRQQFEREHPYPPYSTHSTDINYPDENGLTLLRYAIRLGQLEQVRELIKQGAKIDNPIRYALGNNKLELARYFFERDDDISSIKLSNIRHEPCRGWFIQLIKDSLQASKSNPNAFFQSSPAQSFSNLNRASEIGDIDFLKAYMTRPELVDALFISAIENNQLEVMEFLLQNGAEVTPEKSYKSSPLSRAVNTNSEDGVALLLRHNADVNYVGEEKKTALTTAVLRGSLTLVNTLIAHHANCFLVDAFGRTALHYAAINKCADIVSQLLLAPGGKEALCKQDIYGNTALDYALENQHVETIQLLDDEGLHDSGVARTPLINIDQSSVMKKMRYYLLSQYRDLVFFNENGLCNGFAFLRDMYANKGMESWFYDTLRLMSSWDGSQEVLDKAFDESISQRAYYKNLSELFEQWSNDIIWFQHTTLDSVFNYSSQSNRQSNREFQYSIAGGSNQSPVLISRYRETLDSNCLQENMEIFSTRLPDGCHLELGGSAHATSAFITPDKMFSYYDPNLPRKTRDFIDASDFTGVVIDTKIISLNQYNALGEFDSEQQVFYYFTPEMQAKIAEHEAFSDSQLPSDIDAVDLFQKSSPNQYTPLHVAVLAGSVRTVEKLVAREANLCALRRKNKDGNTAMDIAVSSRNIAVMEALAAGYPHKDILPSENMINHDDIEHAYHEKDAIMLEFFLSHYAKINLGSLFFAAVENHDLSLVSRMLGSKMVEVNAPVFNSLPITEVITMNDIPMLLLFLQHGASPTNVVPGCSDNCSPLYHISGAHNALLEVVLPYLKDINQLDDYGNSLLHYIAKIKQNTGSVLIQALESNADFDLLNTEGKTAFELVVNNTSLSPIEKIRMTKWLLPKMKIKHTNPDFQQALLKLLTIAYAENDVLFFSDILSRCSTDMINQYNTTGIYGGANLLHCAIIDNKNDITERLLDFGIDINIPTKYKRNSCLHLMITTPNTTFLKRFLENGADVTLQNSDKKTVLDVLAESDNDDIKRAFSDENLTEYVGLSTANNRV